MSQTRLNMQEEETAVLHAASRVFAGFAAAGAIDQDNAADFTRFAVRVAVAMAGHVDQEVSSTGEIDMPPIKGG